MLFFIVVKFLFWSLIAISVILSVVLVKEKEFKIIERLGKYKRTAKPGLSFKIPWLDWIAGCVNMKVQQLDVEVETKTKDNVFVRLNNSVQFYVVPEKTSEAFYQLEDSNRQISSYIFDIVRAEVPKMGLDEVFEKKDSIALAISSELEKSMDDFGFKILKTLVTDIDPDQKVKTAMNEIDASRRMKVATQEKAEGEKIKVIKAAEAEKESKKLQGEGIADQRKAIIDGLKNSVEIFSKSAGIDPKEVLSLILTTQYFDTLKEIGGKDGTKVIFLPQSPVGAHDVESLIRNAIISSQEAKQ